MSKNIRISEGHQGHTFTNVKRIETNLAGSNDKQFWVPEDEAGQYADLIDKTITQNGTYNAASEGHDGYKSIDVHVAGGSVGTKNVTSNGTYNASDDGYDGYDKVNVNVPYSPGTSGKEQTDKGTKNFSVAWVSITGYEIPKITGIRLRIFNQT